MRTQLGNSLRTRTLVRGFYSRACSPHILCNMGADDGVVIVTTTDTLRQEYRCEALQNVHCAVSDDEDLSMFDGEHMPCLEGLRIEWCRQVWSSGTARELHFPALRSLQIDHMNDPEAEFSSASFPMLEHLCIRSASRSAVQVQLSLCATLKTLRLCYVDRLHMEGFAGACFPHLRFMDLTGSTTDLSPLEACDLPVLDKFSYCASYDGPLYAGTWLFRLPELTRLKLNHADMSDSCLSE